MIHIVLENNRGQSVFKKVCYFFLQKLFLLFDLKIKLRMKNWKIVREISPLFIWFIVGRFSCLISTPWSIAAAWKITQIRATLGGFFLWLTAYSWPSTMVVGLVMVVVQFHFSRSSQGGIVIACKKKSGHKKSWGRLFCPLQLESPLLYFSSQLGFPTLNS